MQVPAYWAREWGVQAVAYSGVVVEVMKVMGIGIDVADMDMVIVEEEAEDGMLMDSIAEEFGVLGGFEGEGGNLGLLGESVEGRRG